MNYIKDIPRVSSIVSFIYPFGGEDKRRYLEWLKLHNIEEEEYLEGANELGTYIHKQMENFIEGEEIDKTSPFYKETKDIVEHGITYLKSLKGKELLTETYIRDKNNRYQGTIDLIIKEGDEIIICDFKSYGVVKQRYGLPNKFSIDKDKRKKVVLQLSLYAYAMLDSKKDYSCSKLKIILLHNEGVKVYEEELIPRKEIENILTRYYIANKKEPDLIFNADNMEIIIHKPTAQYEFIELKLDLNKVDNGKTAQENIDNMINTMKYLINKNKEIG